MESNRSGGVKDVGSSSDSTVVCDCGLPARISKAWTDKNPGRRFYGCPRFKRRGECNFFVWIDNGEAYGWQKNALIEAREEIREKNRIIEHLKKEIKELREEKIKKEEESIINNFLRL